MVFASGQRMNYLNWLAAQRKVPRLQIVRAFEQARAREEQPATVSLGENPYQGHGAEYADAGEFALGRG